METNQNKVINAYPTKEFFITTLVKDIDLKRSIIDLIDNSVDGAIRLRSEGGQTESFEGLWINLLANKDKFEISDNCGGMSVPIARNYAFRFGRPKDVKDTPNSIGLFGVGMKRAIFKMGKEFWIESSTINDKFILAEDIEDWLAKTDDEGNDIWEFDFEEYEENLELSVEEVGTKITISSLYQSVAEDFDLDTFITQLSEEIREAHMYNIEKGLKITLNGFPIQKREILLASSDQISPAYRTRKIADEKITVKMYAGVAYRNPDSSRWNPKDAGWYIFCNNRLILGADRTFVTGWGENNGKSVPTYHNDYASFRGYVFFESKDSYLLPWNTTKTGVDTNAASFRAIRNDLINMMKPVIQFLRAYRKEQSDDTLEERILETAIDISTALPLMDISNNDVFQYPLPGNTTRSSSPYKSIKYVKHVDEINRVKKELGLSTNKEVGEKTFEYFWKMEFEE